MTASQRDALLLSGRALPLVAVTFVLNGMFIGLWGGSLAGLRARVGTDERGIAVLLIAVGLAAITAMQVGGRWSDRSGTRTPVLLGGALMTTALVLIAHAPGYGLLVASAILLGAGNGLMDVAMNTLAVHVERAHHRPVMSLIHGFFSIGSLLGAALVLVVSAMSSAAPGRVVWAAMLLGAGLGAVTLAGLHARLPQTPPAPTRDDGSRTRIPPVAWLLAAMAVCFGVAEGTAWDWASIHVTDVVGTTPGRGAVGLMVVSALMVAVRMVGDRLVARAGRRAVVIGGGLTALAGYALTATTSSLGPVLLGWALVGLGVGCLAPQIYGLAGHVGGGRTLAVVAGAGYATMLAGPGVIGLVAHEAGLQRAMLVPAAAAVVIAVLALRMPRSPEEAAARGRA